MYTLTREEFLATGITPADPSPADTGCLICTEDYNTTTHTAVTFSDHASCNHIFCESCIVTWLTSDKTNTCPLCRRELFALPPKELYSDYVTEEEEDDDDDDDGEYDYDSEEEQDDDDEDTPLSYLYRNDLRIIMTPPEITHLLETTWHKTWNLLSTYRSESARARQENSQAFAWTAFDRYLPTTNTLLDAFLDTVATLVGGDISGLLGVRKLGTLEALLGIVMDVQKGIIREGGKEEEEEDFVPGFPGTWEPLCSWSVNVSQVLGITLSSSWD